jgi:hypothetical protein
LYSSQTGLVYERKSAQSRWQSWKPQHRPARYNTRSQTQTYIADSVGDGIPDDAVPISIIKESNTIKITHRRHRRIEVNVNNDQMRPTAANTTINTRTQFFMYNIILNNGAIFSDGSYDNGVASYAILLQPQRQYHSLQEINFDDLVYCSDTVDGSQWDLNSYRAELRGILAAIEFTNDLCSRTNITNGTCTLYCDSKDALYAAFGHKRPTPRWSSFDLVVQIRRALITSNIKWIYKHVKGHQDAHYKFHQLD